MHVEPCVRRGERDGNAYDGDESGGERDAGYADVSEREDECGELRGGRAGGYGADLHGELERIDDGGDVVGDGGAYGVYGVFGSVLVRGKLIEGLGARGLRV